MAIRELNVRDCRLILQGITMKPINWPTPYNYEFKEDLNTFDSEPCLVIFKDKHELRGNIKSFLPEKGILEILSVNGDITKPRLPFFFQLHLTRRVMLKKRVSWIGENHAEDMGVAEKQRCSILFTNGQKLEGVTNGFVDDKSGLYLFLAESSGSVIRCFIPTHAIGTYQIGETIGQMLIRDNIASQEVIEADLKKQEQLRAKPIGEYLSVEQIVTHEQLIAAVRRYLASKLLRIGELLVQKKLITEYDLKSALATQRLDRKKPLGEIIISMGIADENAIKHMLVKKLGIPFVNIKNYNVDPKAVLIVPVSFAKKYSIMPLLIAGKKLIVAMENPMHWELLNELSVITHLHVEPVIASEADILYSLTQHYKPTGNLLPIDDIASDLILVEDEDSSPEENVAESDNTLVNLVNKVIVDAYHKGVSDIHVETYSGKRNTIIRFRIDGALSKYFELPPNFRSAFISRIKIMAKLDISEKRKPQDGKIEFKFLRGEKIELRVTTLPTTNGLEDIIMRILAASKPILIEKIGLAADVLERIKKLVVKPYGFFLVCGPTGSGKTTTLHSILAFINTPERKICTAEDPIEITQDGLRQVQVNSRIGWTFAAAMRSFLRADPDVIMVGEMRDVETAKIAIEASLTGHMVFSTLHTNSATESIVRLLDLGMDPFNFSDSLVGILAQRLVKRYCEHCKKNHIASVDEVNNLAQEYCQNTPLDPDTVYQQWQKTYANENGEFVLSSANGCTECGGTGYKGRMGVYEFLEASTPIKKLIQQRATVENLLFKAIKQGMCTLKQDGIEKILQGYTDIFQIRAVCN